MGSAVDRDGARSTNVQHAEFAAFAEVFRTEFRLRFEREWSRGGYGCADNCSVKVDVDKVKCAGFKERLQKEGFAEFRRGHAGKADGVGHLHELHSSSIASSIKTLLRRRGMLACMSLPTSRRSFLATASLAVAAVPFVDAQTPSTPVPFHLFPAGELEASREKLVKAPGNDSLFHPAGLPLTIVLTVEEKKAAKEFEWHEGRDHIFQIVDGATVYELGGTPRDARSTKPGEWLAPASDGARRVELKKGDMLVIPRGTPHRRTTADSVTFYLISAEGAAPTQR